MINLRIYMMFHYQYSKYLPFYRQSFSTLQTYPSNFSFTHHHYSYKNQIFTQAHLQTSPLHLIQILARQISIIQLAKTIVRLVALYVFTRYFTYLIFIYNYVIINNYKFTVIFIAETFLFLITFFFQTIKKIILHQVDTFYNQSGSPL